MTGPITGPITGPLTGHAAGQRLVYCIGAAKAGTSWLFDQLRQHPACRISKVKELHYFDSLHHGKGGYFRTLLEERAGILRWRAEREQDAAVLEFQRAAIADIEDWLARWDFRARDDAAYLAHLRGEGGDMPAQVIGDFTPAYALLPAQWFGRMAALAEETRFIYLMRDPVERIWSHFRMDAGEGGEAVALAKVDAFLEGGEEDVAERSNYRRTINRLMEEVPREQVFLGFYEELFTPEMMARLWAFLGLEPIEVDFSKRVNPSAPARLDDERRARLRHALRQQYNFVERFMGELPANWTDRKVAA